MEENIRSDRSGGIVIRFVPDMSKQNKLQCKTDKEFLDEQG